MKRLLSIGMLVLLAACHKKEAQPVTEGSQPFFKFDQVDHYHLDISRGQYDSIAAKPDQTKLEQGLMQILQQRIPVSTIDSLFIPNMDILKFRKHTVNPSANATIAQLFSVRKPAVAQQLACEPIFKDVLVFREKGKFIGVAKLSFDCEKSYIIGSRYGTAGFGADGEFGKLHELLANE